MAAKARIQTPRGRWLKDNRAIVTCPFGKRGWWKAGHHTGVDIAVPGASRIPVVWALTRPGKVVQIGGCGEPYGLHVLIRGGHGHVWLFAHLSSLQLVQGQVVSNGQTIGKTGTTGTHSSGDHLHLEKSRGPVWRYGDTVKPLVYPAYGRGGESRP